MLLMSHSSTTVWAKSKDKIKIQVHAKVDTNAVVYGESFVLKVFVESNGQVKIRSPKLSRFTAFELLRDWTSSNISTKVVYGAQGTEMQSSRQKVFSYELRLKENLKHLKQGSRQGSQQRSRQGSQQGKQPSPSYVIEPIEVWVQGKKFLTKRISIKALHSDSPQVQKRQASRRRRRQVPGFFPDSFMEDWMSPFSFGKKKASSKISQEDLDKAFFVHLEADKIKAFVGEAVPVKWYIYTVGQVRQLERVQFPKLKGFWKEDIESAPRLQFEPATVNGLPYRRALLASHIIFPIKAGKALVDAYEVKAEVLLGGGKRGRKSNNPLSSFFARSYSLQRKSEFLELEVLPLPPLPPDPPFLGGVGTFNLTAEVESKTVTMNEPFSLKVRFAGKGNAKRIKAPKLILPPQLELYNQSSQAEFFKNGSSYKEFDFLLILKSQKIVLDPLRVLVFNPEFKKYQELKTQAISLQALQEMDSTLSSKKTIAKRFFSVPSADKQKEGLPLLLPYWQKGGPSFWWQPAFKQWGFWLGFMLLGFLGLLFYAYQQGALFPQKKRNRKQEFQKRWQKAESQFQQKNWTQLGVELCNLVYFTLSPQEVSSDRMGNLQTLLQHSPPSVQKYLMQPLLQLTYFFQGLSFEQHQGNFSQKEEEAIGEKMRQLKQVLLQFPNKGFHHK